MSNYISYDNILKDRNNFRKSGTYSGSEFNLFDTQSHKYFKLFFYFNNGDVSGDLSANNGLLTPTWFVDGIDDKTYYMYNSAWSYLKMNDEDDRADLLQNFVNLLSNISSESPWYFSEISGLDAALDRKAINADNFIIEQARQKITIKCLPDSVDERIGTLLDLYRSIVWDWISKREVLPANLRKFDMGIFIFETPSIPMHKTNTYADIGESQSNYQTSYKYIELHNCEIDYNSTKNAYTTLNNKEGFENEYNIEIYFDDCYETRYNEFIMNEIGDLIVASTQQQVYKDKYNTELNSRINYYGNYESDDEELKKFDDGRFKEKRVVRKIPNKNGFISNAVGQLINLGVDYVNDIVKKAVLGNLYTFSLTRLSNQAKGLIQGDIITAARNVSEYIRDQDKSKTSQVITRQNLFSDKKTITNTIKNLGNLSQNNTIANNI